MLFCLVHLLNLFQMMCYINIQKFHYNFFFKAKNREENELYIILLKKGTEEEIDRQIEMGIEKKWIDNKKT